MLVRHLWDGFVSFVAAAVTLSICSVPVWYTYLALMNGLAPPWVWVPTIALSAIGIILALAFGRKAMRGISPSRERRRR